MRRAAWLVMLVMIATLTSCERERAVVEVTDAHLTLNVETPEALEWGGTGILRVTVANESEAVTEGGIVEVYVPSWLEFGTVEPPGTEVTVLSGDETRLSYAFPDSLLPGDRRTVLQHLRVRLPPPPVAQQPDTVDMVRLAPLDQTVRARLLKLTGEPAGAEVQVNLQFVGAGPVRPAVGSLVPGDTMPPADTVPVDTTLARPPPDTVRRT